MNYEDIEVGSTYMVYEENTGQVEVLGKAVVGGQELLWIKCNNTTKTCNPKHVSEIPMQRGEAISQFASDMQDFFKQSYTAKEMPQFQGMLYDFVASKLNTLIEDVDDGKINWSVEYG